MVRPFKWGDKRVFQKKNKVIKIFNRGLFNGGLRNEMSDSEN